MYSVGDWYWSINGKIFSSKAMAYVDESEAGYAEFVASGETPTWINSTHELFGVLRSHLEAELSELDAVIPRGLEDTWAVMGIDVSALPAIQQERISKKIKCRHRIAEIANIIRSGGA